MNLSEHLLINLIDFYFELIMPKRNKVKKFLIKFSIEENVKLEHSFSTKDFSKKSFVSKYRISGEQCDERLVGGRKSCNFFIETLLNLFFVIFLFFPLFFVEVKYDWIQIYNIHIIRQWSKSLLFIYVVFICLFYNNK